jgi:hypothetical protein
MCRNKFAIVPLVKTRLDPERRVLTDRGHNVADQLKRIGLKSPPGHSFCSWRPNTGGDFRCNPKGTQPFGPLALLLVAHDRLDHAAPRV